MVTRALTITFILTLALRVQAQSCFATVQLDRHSVYVQQPFRVTITVMTATWFTAPVEFDNLQVPNSFVIPFDRNSPGMFDHNGKQYAGIQFFFIVFPYHAGDFTLPPIVVHATTPPEGSSESKRVTIRTAARKFKVKPVPAGIKADWLVAKSVRIHEHWNKALSSLKVGDVVERTVTVNARGTLPQFIPALKETDLSFANVYPQDPELKDLRDEYDANGELTQSFIYLLEKEGSFTIPPMEINWWNPGARKMMKRSLRKHEITVHPNPNLGMVSTIKDSLESMQRPQALAVEKKPLRILGMKWYVFAGYALATLALAAFVIRRLWNFIKGQRARYNHYRQSERYWFRKVRSSSPEEFWHLLYEWWDHVDYDRKAEGLVNALQESGDEATGSALTRLNEEIYHNGNRLSHRVHNVKARLSRLRRWLYTKQDEEKDTLPGRQQGW